MIGDAPPGSRAGRVSATGGPAGDRRRPNRRLLTAGVRSATVTLADVSAQAATGDDFAGRLKVTTLLRAVAGWGGKKAADVMTGIGIDGNRRVGGLDSHQRAELIARTTAQP